jgi:hypothetical protein
MTASYADRSNTASLNRFISHSADSAPPVENMGIDQRSFDIAMARQFLNRSYIIATFEHVWRKGIPERPCFVSQAPVMGSLAAFCASNPRCDGGLVA